MPGWLGAGHNYGFHVLDASPLVLRHFLFAQRWARLWAACLGYRGEEDNSSPLKELAGRDAGMWMTQAPAIILSLRTEGATGELGQACQEQPTLRGMLSITGSSERLGIGQYVPAVTTVQPLSGGLQPWPRSNGPALGLPIACSEHILKLCL